MHLRKICRELKIPKTTLNYHLIFLEKRDLIFIKSEKGYHRYYVAETVGNRDKEILSLIRQSIPRKIILFLFLYPENSRGAISSELDKPPTTVSYHLTKLIDLDIICRHHVAHKIVYKIKNQKTMYELLIKYEKSLLLDDMMAKYLLNWVKYVIPDGVPIRSGIDGSSDVDEIYEYLLEIFPHPYHS